MKAEIHGTYQDIRCRNSCLYLNCITVLRNDGQTVILDRDETEYEFMEDGSVGIVFRDTYEYNSESCDCRYLNNNAGEDIALYDGAVLISADIEEDAPEWYDLEITPGQRISCW